MSRKRLFAATFIFIVAAAMIVAVVGRLSRSAEANHAWQHSEGVGFAELDLSPTFGWIDVYVHSPPFGSDAIAAIDAWKELHNENLWLLRHTTDPAEAEIEIMDTDQVSIFPDNVPRYGTGHPWGSITTFNCAYYFNPGSQAYATTYATDDYVAIRSTYQNAQDGATFGFWVKNPGHPFIRATICMNSFQTGNDQGTIAH